MEPLVVEPLEAAKLLLLLRVPAMLGLPAVLGLPTVLGSVPGVGLGLLELPPPLPSLVVGLSVGTITLWEL